MATICEKCGAERDYIDAECPACHFHPKTVRELATAAFLTSEFEAGEESFGTPQETLAAIAQEIRDGKQPAFSQDELLRHEHTVKVFLEVKPIHIYGALFRLFLPAFLFLAALWGVYAILCYLRR